MDYEATEEKRLELAERDVALRERSVDAEIRHNSEAQRKWDEAEAEHGQRNRERDMVSDERYVEWEKHRDWVIERVEEEHRLLARIAEAVEKLARR